MSVYIIAEAGVNHNGKLELALKLIDHAVEAGVDAVKFQTFKSSQLVSAKAPKAEYQTKTTGSSESQLEMLKKLELSEKDHEQLIAHCAKKRIQFLSTPFDLESADLLIRRFNLPRIKVGSGDVTNAPLLLKIAQSGKPMILSTGMSSLGEIEQSLGVLAFGYLAKKENPSTSAFKEAFASAAGRAVLREKLALLHCTTEYPAPFDEVNLKAMSTLRETFGVEVGFSDHTPGISAPIAAVACGASIIEKHFTTDRNLPGPDHKASLEPQELRTMVQSIREVEKALGSATKKPTASESKNREIARRSLVASKTIKKGETFSEDNLAVKRPGNGVDPIHFWAYLGKKASRDYEADEKVDTL